MKLRKLLPIVFLSIAGLSACGPKDVYDINFANLSDIVAEWHVGDADRVLQLEATKNGEAVNVPQLLNSEIFVTSSNTDVLGTVGLVLKAVSAGEAKLKVDYHGTTLEAELNILPVRTCIDKYGTVHAGTEADPLDYADAMKIGADMKAAAKSTDEDDIYIKGVVKSWYHFPGERAGNDEATSWFIEGAEGDTNLFEMYKITKADGKTLTDEDIWIGAEVVIKGQIGYYNSQLETTKGTFVKVTGGATRPEVATHQVGVNTKNTGALAVGATLADGDTTWDKYEITGYVVNNLGGKEGAWNYMIADSATETASNKMFEIYGHKTQLNYKAKVVVHSRIKNYHGTIETNLLTEVEVLEEGVEWPNYPEPTLNTTGGIAGLIADTAGNYKQLYEVKGVITKWKDDKTTDATKYGNFYVKAEDSDAEIYVYGASATAKSLSWNKYANVYSFVNPQDFLTNSITKVAAIGEKITLRLTRCDYTDKDGNVTVEGTGIVLSVGDKADYVAAYSGSETTNMVENENNAAAIGLDATKFEVISEKGGASNHVGLNKAGNIRLYSVEGAAGNSLVIKAKAGSIAKIKLTIVDQGSGKGTNEQYLQVFAGETQVTAAQDGSYTINAAQFTLVNNAQIKSTQIWFSAISIWVAA